MLLNCVGRHHLVCLCFVLGSLAPADALSVTRRKSDGGVQASSAAAESAGIWQGMQSTLTTLLGDCSTELCKQQIALLRTFRPCATCAHTKRYGWGHDGGYTMCESLLGVGGMTPKAAYSLGINGNDGWGGDMSDRFGIPVYQYDCTNSKRPICPKRMCELEVLGKCAHSHKKKCDFHFFDQCIVDAGAQPHLNKSKYVTLDQMMDVNGHHGVLVSAGEPDLIMKMDIEGNEWDILSSRRIQHLLPRFSQISFELHAIGGGCWHGGCTETNSTTIRKQLSAMQNLLEHFDVVLLHGNNFEPMSKVGKYQVPLVLEVLLVNKKFPMKMETTCEPDPPYTPANAKNNGDLPELPPAHLPRN